MGKAFKVDRLVVREPGHDGEPPIFADSKDFVWVDGQREPVKGPQNLNVDRIEWLFSQGLIEDYHKEAARRFEKDYEMGEIMPVASLILAGAGGRSDFQPANKKIDAMQRFQRALKTLGPRAGKLMELVVLHRMSVEKAGAQMGMNAKKAPGAFQIAIDVLAAHYGLC